MSASSPPLRCPSCRGDDGAGGFRAWPLSRDAEGYHCEGCGARYPMVDGVPVIAQDHGAITAQPPRQSDADAWCDALSTADPTSVAAREAWLLTMYALSHHPGACPSTFVQASMHDQGALGALLKRWLDAHGPIPGDTLELGCGVAGHASLWRETTRGGVTLCDLRPGMLALTRELRAGREVSLPWRQMGRHHTPVTLQREPADEAGVHYIVGDALDPPFAAEHFQLVVALNLLDTVRDPWMLLGQLDALTAPGGLLLLGQPFHYEAHAQHPEGWFQTPEGLHGALSGGLAGLEHLDYTPLEVADAVPWSLPAHDRLVHRYGMHLVLARKG